MNINRRVRIEQSAPNPCSQLICFCPWSLSKKLKMVPIDSNWIAWNPDTQLAQFISDSTPWSRDQHQNACRRCGVDLAPRQKGKRGGRISVASSDPLPLRSEFIQPDRGLPMAMIRSRNRASAGTSTLHTEAQGGGVPRRRWFEMASAVDDVSSACWRSAIAYRYG